MRDKFLKTVSFLAAKLGFVYVFETIDDSFHIFDQDVVTSDHNLLIIVLIINS